MSAITNNPTAVPLSSSHGYSALGSEDFIKVMFAELSRQDPLQPNDTSKLLEQIGTIRAIESDLSLQKNLTSLIRQNEVSNAGGLIGKFAVGLTDDAQRVRGFVDSIIVTREGVRLNLSSGFQISMARVEEVIDPALVGQTPSPGSPPPPPPPGDDDTEPPPTGGPIAPGEPDGRHPADEVPGNSPPGVPTTPGGTPPTRPGTTSG